MTPDPAQAAASCTHQSALTLPQREFTLSASHTVEIERALANNQIESAISTCGLLLRSWIGEHLPLEHRDNCQLVLTKIIALASFRIDPSVVPEHCANLAAEIPEATAATNALRILLDIQSAGLCDRLKLNDLGFSLLYAIPQDSLLGVSDQHRVLIKVVLAVADRAMFTALQEESSERAVILAQKFLDFISSSAELTISLRNEVTFLKTLKALALFHQHDQGVGLERCNSVLPDLLALLELSPARSANHLLYMAQAQSLFGDINLATTIFARILASYSPSIEQDPEFQLLTKETCGVIDCSQGNHQSAHSNFLAAARLSAELYGRISKQALAQYQASLHQALAAADYGVALAIFKEELPTLQAGHLSPTLDPKLTLELLILKGRAEIALPRLDDSLITARFIVRVLIVHEAAIPAAQRAEALAEIAGWFERSKLFELAEYYLLKAHSTFTPEVAPTGAYLRTALRLARITLRNSARAEETLELLSKTGARLDGSFIEPDQLKQFEINLTLLRGRALMQKEEWNGAINEFYLAFNSIHGVEIPAGALDIFWCDLMYALAKTNRLKELESVSRKFLRIKQGNQNEFEVSQYTAIAHEGLAFALIKLKADHDQGSWLGIQELDIALKEFEICARRGEQCKSQIIRVLGHLATVHKKLGNLARVEEINRKLAQLR